MQGTRGSCVEEARALAGAHTSAASTSSAPGRILYEFSSNHFWTSALFSATHLMLAFVLSRACSSARVAEPNPTSAFSALNCSSCRAVRKRRETCFYPAGRPACILTARGRDWLGCIRRREHSGGPCAISLLLLQPAWHRASPSPPPPPPSPTAFFRLHQEAFWKQNECIIHPAAFLKKTI